MPAVEEDMKSEVTNNVFSLLFGTERSEVKSGSTEEKSSLATNSVHFEQDGSVYEGELKNNLKHGKGKEIWSGNCYEGSFEKGMY